MFSFDDNTDSSMHKYEVSRTIMKSSKYIQVHAFNFFVIQNKTENKQGQTETNIFEEEFTNI